MRASYFTIHNFMTEDLGLRNTPLRVFALVYSFSHDGVGVFRGSRNYAAESVGASIRAVDTALKRLADDGLIIKKHAENPWFPSTYRVSQVFTDPYLADAYYGVERDKRPSEVSAGGEQASAEGAERATDAQGCKNCTGGVQILHRGVQYLHGEGAKRADNNQEYKEVINKCITTTTDGTTAAQMRRTEEIRELMRKSSESEYDDSFGKPLKYGMDPDIDEPQGTYKIRYYSYDGNVPLSAMQYEHLLSLVGSELERYLCTIMRMISAPKMTPDRRAIQPHSCYKTILKWIHEDYGDETVLKNLKRR